MIEIEKGVFEVPLYVPSSLEQYKDKIYIDLINAQKRIVKFAYANDLGNLFEESFMDSAEIFENQEDFISRILYVTGIDESVKLPNTISACLEFGIFMAVSPDVYELLYTDLYNEEIDKRFEYEKLIAHEIAHCLHLRILNDNDELMGPTWFYEGFALYAANQFDNFNISKEEIWDIIENDKKVSYKYYSAIFRYLTQNFSIKELLNKTGDNDFIQYLKNRIG